MSAELPVACTLPMAELPSRVELMRSLALVSASVDGVRAALRFPAGEEERLRALVAAEQEGPAGSEPAVAEWASAFTAR